MAFNYDEYLRTDKMPTLWCWGCGDGVILKALIRAIDKLGWNMDDVCVVSGIGCSGRFSSYINCNTVHTTHGRTLPYATGIKMANPNVEPCNKLYLILPFAIVFSHCSLNFLSCSFIILGFKDANLISVTEICKLNVICLH